MKILVILSRIPYPLEKGDKLRAYHQVKELSKNHEVCLCCLSENTPLPEAADKLASIASEVHFFQLNRTRIYVNLFLAALGRKPFQVAYFYQSKVHRKIRNRIQTFNPEHIFCQLVRTAEYAKNVHNIPKTLDYQDAFSKGMDRRADHEKNRLKRYLFRSESKRLLIYEHLIFDFFEHKCIISEQDKALIYHEKQNEIAVIPNGVDFDFFRPTDADKQYDLCFVGNMSYAPNVDSVLYLVNEILPLLVEKKPYIKVLIAGADPTDAIIQLQNKHVTVAGWVDDIRQSYAQSRIFIAPMQIGTGLQNKLLEAMAMKIPCITSKLANAALGATSGVHLMVGKKPEEYAQQVIQLLDKPKVAAELAENGHNFISQRYSWSGSAAQLEALMQSRNA